jgi:CubicO group peptidase (beta-lactamase class C family)
MLGLVVLGVFLGTGGLMGRPYDHHPAAQGGRPDTADTTRLAQAMARVDTMLARRMAEDQVPGAAVAITTREALLHMVTRGVADLERRTPVTPHTLFQVGSLTKAITAGALLQMREEGLLELDRPVTTYLPWFGVKTRFAPVTLHHLLTHTAGLPRDRDDIPSSPYAAVALRERELAFPPGIRFAYSNIGYQLLSLLMEEVEGQPFGELLTRRMLRPLRMDSTAAVITNAIRPRLAIGYQYLYDDRPPHPTRPVVPATWAEHGAGDASVASTATDMASFLQMLLSRGEGPGERVLAPGSVGLMTARAVEAASLGKYARYGYGLVADSLDGRAIRWHSGGMLGFRSHILLDPTLGLGVVVLLNGPGNAHRIAEFALRAASAGVGSGPMPDLPAPVPSTLVSNATDYAGDYTGVLGDSVSFEAVGERLDLVVPEGRATLERLGSDRFYADLPEWDLFQFQFGRDSADQVVEVAHGNRWFAGARHRGPRQFDPPAQWLSSVGHYRSSIPWYNNFRVIIRRGALLLVAPEGTEELLVPMGQPGRFRIGTAAESAEELVFDTVITGRALRATLSGVAYYRSFVP